MNKYIYIIGVLLSTWTLPMFSQVSNDNEDEVNKVDTRFAKNDFVPGQVLVKFKDANRVQIRRSQGQFASTNVDKVTEVMQKYGVSEMEQLLPNEKPNRQLRRAKAYNGDVIQEHDLSQLYCVTLSTEHQHETMQIVDELKGLEEVEFAEPNYRIYMMADTHIADDYSGNPMESQQWYLDSCGVKELWNKPIINKERPIIAILDTGVDLTHPDLKDNLWTNNVEAFGTKDNDNDGNGFKNDVHGWDFVNNTANIRDNNMHGTHVAGIAAASNNGIGIVGANPQALVMPITVLQSDGAGDVATIIKGIDYAIANGATVLNMSLGTYVNSHALRQSLENAYSKAVLVAAAGNDGKCIYFSHSGLPDHPIPPEPCFPAAYSFVLGVQATVKGGSLAPYSNYDDDGAMFSCESTFFNPDGFNYELKVPGSSILSTIPGGSYKKLNGTSMAAPLAAGAISALKMVKQYDSQEILWCDLLHANNIAEAYYLSGNSAELDLQRIILRNHKEISDLTEEDYSDDNEVDAGETVNIYPVIRSTYGTANNIKLKLMLDEFEDPDVVEIINGEVDFGIRLDAYGKAVSKNPLVVKISNNIADQRYISLKIFATCDNINMTLDKALDGFPFSLVAHNMIKINGLITQDMTLTADHIYYVNGSLGVNKGATLTIEPGTRLEFAGGAQLRSFGKLIAKGTPEKPIVFTRHIGENSWNGIYTHEPEGKHEYQYIYTNKDTTLFTMLPTESTPIKLGELNKTVYYGTSEKAPSKTFDMWQYIGMTEWLHFLPDLSGKKHLLKDPNYLTPAITKMIKEYKEYCSCYSETQTENKNNSAQITIHLDNRWAIYDNPGDTLSYCRIEYCNFSADRSELIPYMKDCVIMNVSGLNGFGECNLMTQGTLQLSNPSPQTNVKLVMKHTNIVNNLLTYNDNRYSNIIINNNFFNNYGKINNKDYSLSINALWPTIDNSYYPAYLGTSREDMIRPYIYEIGNVDDTWGIIDLSNMPKEPYKEAHGIVWKVLVNGKDAQDEFEDMAPLGVGKHKFEVYFNRPMNKAVTPQIFFGVRDPYTQQSVAENGSWNDEGTIYTAYKTITGKTMSDGLNRIYVYGAEDNEYFPCPYEKNRFNVVVQAAGSLATGFAAEEGFGCVNLKWDKPSKVQEDAMGLNVFRYHQRTVPGSWSSGSYIPTYIVNDTIQLNQDILDLETTSLTDYGVTPGETYYYFYKILNTDLQGIDMSNTVSATPRTSTLGDANGSGIVDIADVITTVNFITKQNPQPFIFEAADMNSDNNIDILDVMGIVKGILNPNLLAASMIEGSATYTIEDGVLYVESDISLGGVQVQLTIDGRSQMEDVRIAKDLEGFEQASTWLSDNDFIFLAYSLNGKTLTPGKHALLYIGDSEISSLRLSDTTGKNINVSSGDGTTGIDRMGKHVMNVNGVYDLQGRKLSSTTPLKNGIYIINGKKVVK